MTDSTPALKDTALKDTALKDTALKDWRFSIDGEGIAWAVFDREGESANSLGRRPIQELFAIVERVEAEARAKNVKGLVIISGKEKGFIVGADIREFELLETEQQVIDGIRPVNAMLDRIERLPIPVVAAWHGVCVGGGLELVLACHYRIATRDDATRTKPTPLHGTETPFGFYHLKGRNAVYAVYRQSDDAENDTVAAFVGLAGPQGGDGAVGFEIVADRLAEPAGAVAVHHPHLAAGAEHGAVDEALERFEGRLDPLADQVDFGRHLRLFGLIEGTGYRSPRGRVRRTFGG